MLNTKICTSHKLFSFELCTIINKDPGHVDPKYYALQKLDRYILRDVYYCHCFNPFCECVNGYEEMSIAPWSSGSILTMSIP
jgi:hypothetical protein